MNRAKRQIALLALLAAMPLAAQTTAKPAAAKPAVKSAANDNKGLLESADRLAAEGKLNQARAAYERALKSGAVIDHDYARSRNLGLCYLNGTPQNLAEATKWLEIAWKLTPSDEDTRLALAQAFNWSRNYEKSAEHYRALHEAHRQNADYVMGLSDVLFAKGDSDGAFQAVQEYLESNPSDVSMRLNYARLLSYSKKFPEALSQYQAVLQIEPNNLPAQVGIAKVTSWQGHPDVALEMYNNILQKHPTSYDAQVGKAFSLMWTGKKEQAWELFTALRQRDPNDKDVASALKSLPLTTAPIVTQKPRSIVPAKKEETVAPAARLIPEPAATPAAEAVAPTKTEEAPAPAEKTAAEKVTELMESAEAASSAGNYADAIHRYHQVLEIDPTNVAAQIQIGRVLSWSKAFDDSVAQYSQILKAAPENTLIRSERARVLSWGKHYDESLGEYAIALKQAEAAPSAEVNPRQLRTEYARVLGWSRRYEDALKQYAILLPADKKVEASDAQIALDNAHVLTWSRHYPEAIAAYNRAIALGGGTFEARLGKAQAVYYSGRLRESALMLRALQLERPKDPDASFMLASVEHGLGYNARSLSLLNYAANNSETDDLRHSIHSEMRPVLRFRYGNENDREEESNGTVTGIKALRYTSALEFNIHPDVRMEIVNTFTDGLTSNALLGTHRFAEYANEVEGRLNFRVRPGLQMIVGAGDGVTGGHALLAPTDRSHHFIFDAHPTITKGDLRIDLAVSRHIADYTPLSIDDNVLQTRLTAAASYNWLKRYRIGAEYWHGYYSVRSPQPLSEYSTEGNGGTAYFMPTLFKNDRFMLEAGPRFDSFTFDDGAQRIIQNIGSAGFFTPRLYQRIAGAANASWTPYPKLRFDFNGTFGPQRLFGFSALNPPPASWGNTGSFGTVVSYNFGTVFTSFAYDYFSTATAAFAGFNNGAYKSHVFSFSVSKRF